MAIERFLQSDCEGTLPLGRMHRDTKILFSALSFCEMSLSFLKKFFKFDSSARERHDHLPESTEATPCLVIVESIASQSSWSELWISHVSKKMRMEHPAIFEQPLERLREHTEPPTSQPRAQINEYSIENEHAVRELLGRWNIPTPLVSANVSAAIKCQIVRHRRVRTTTSRVVEIDVREIICNHPLPAIVMRKLFEKLYQFFLCVERRRPQLLPSGVNTMQLSATQMKYYLHPSISVRSGSR